MKILTDCHHRDLYYSLHQLFVERLGFELFRPMGIEWEQDGWWKVWGCNDPNLSHREAFIIPDKGLNVGSSSVNDGLWDTLCPWHNYTAKSISLDRFKQEKFDIIIPSYPVSHYILWKELRDQFQPNAVVINHYGNIDVSPDTDHAIHSVPLIGDVKNSVLVHQELNTNIYKRTSIPKDKQNVTAFTSPYQFPELWESHKEHMPGYNWKYHGGDSPDGWIEGPENVARVMQASNLGWSTKFGGGLGHTNMGWMYSGRPVITNMSEHTRFSSGGTALKIFEPGVTCIDLDAGTVEENCKTIRKWMDPEVGQKHGDLCADRFREVINYRQEADDVKQFLAKIL